MQQLAYALSPHDISGAAPFIYYDDARLLSAADKMSMPHEDRKET